MSITSLRDWGFPQFRGVVATDDTIYTDAVVFTDDREAPALDEEHQRRHAALTSAAA